MDMSPPPSPPVQTQSRFQESLEAFHRVVGFQAWLANEQAAIPPFPHEEGSDTQASYLVALETYWNSPTTDTSGRDSRRHALARHMADAARDLAVLAHQDGRLGASELASIRSLTSTGAPSLAPGVTIRELMFNDTAYAGVLLLHHEHDANRTLVFSPDHGWESFPRLVDAHAELERRTRLALVHTVDLAGIARQHLGSIGPDPFVSSREITGNPFTALVDRVMRVQEDKLRQAWFEHTLDDDASSRTQVLADTAFDALRLERTFDVEAMLASRHAALLTALNEQRLERVPVTVATGWRDANSSYQETLRSIAGREAAAGLQPATDLRTYASQAIAERLRALGVTDDPAGILVHMDRSTDPAARLESLQGLFEGTASVQVKLVDLAYQNIAAFDPVRLSATTSEGSPLTMLDDARIRNLVRGLDLSTRYRAYVENMYRSGDDAALRRIHSTDLQREHMRLLAAEARLSYYLDEAPRSFRPDHAERGYRWVEAALARPSPKGRARVEGHEVVVRQVTYLDTPLRDILMFGARHAESVQSIVLYTPDAPDGVTFREFDDKADAGRRFFYHPAFREYLLDRLPADYARVLPNGRARQFAGDHLANWVLGASTTSGYTRTAARFEDREVDGDFLVAAYELDVQSGLRNMQVFARSAEHADWAWLRGQQPGTLLNQIVMDVLKGIVIAPSRAAQASWRLYDNVKAGDYPEAVVDFADFYNASLSAALPVYALSSTAAAHAIAGARFRAGTRLVEASPAVQPAVVFEPRFMARNVRKSGKADREGIYTIGGKTYIEHHDALYRVIHDNDIASWRLARPDAGTPFRGPAIQRTATGSWSYHRVGLRGGSGRGLASSPERLPDLYDELQAQVELAFPDAFERDLVATRMRFERTPYAGRVEGYVPPMISEAQRVRWTGAMERARAQRALRTALPGTNPADVALRLTRPPGASGGLHPVTRAQAPADLWYYGKLPFKDSDLHRHRGTFGYSTEMAELSVQYVGEGTYGVRVTTVPPTAPIGEIRRAMGAPDLTRTTTFSVRIDPASLYEPMSGTWRNRYWLAGDGPLAELLMPAGGPGNVFFARPRDGGRLSLGMGQFQVESTLPPGRP
jgi:hypothetical protein